MRVILFEYQQIPLELSADAARQKRELRVTAGANGLKRDDFSSNRHPALGYWWSMIFSENRFTLFGIML